MEVREAVHGAVLEALVDGGHHFFHHLDHIDGTTDLLDPMVDLTDPMVDLMDLMVDLMDHMDGILEILTVFQAIEVWKVVDSTEMMAVNEFWKCCCTLVAYADLYRSKLYRKLSTCESSQKTGRRIGCCWLDCIGLMPDRVDCKGSWK